MDTLHEGLLTFMTVSHSISPSAVKVKVKFTLEQATKAQTGIRTLCLTSALRAGAWLAPRPGRFTPGTETPYPLDLRLPPGLQYEAVSLGRSLVLDQLFGTAYSRRTLNMGQMYGSETLVTNRERTTLGNNPKVITSDPVSR